VILVDNILLISDIKDEISVTDDGSINPVVPATIIFIDNILVIKFLNNDDKFLPSTAG